ncbi:hypothetical protein GSI_12057 [Ganoderma sinense ZZ0214-1]|uniref:BTB domain-containing protein n=1 Tax=Ganoderma sinense ZZ0214-1 TaxID=1077348 RepID=A0A2G8RXR0_9APHY|nr:hypothetical protein GSI_12057 [Ganoderma sinense ZZ0214-1]
MQADETPLSRKRTRASPRNDNPPSLSKDEEFWYEDGTLVLIAANIEFRVYRGPLAKHSPVFRDLLALPQPPSSQSAPSTPIGSDTCPPCPKVHVTDSPSDLRHFLRAFVPGGTLDGALDAPKFGAVSAWIRLGHKYEVDKLVENSLQYLRRFYPKVLSESLSVCSGPIKKDRPEDVQGPHAIAIVNLARLTGSNDLLPLALLECCKLGAGIVSGYVREDGTVEHLHPDDLGRCFAAKEKLALRVVSAYLHVFEVPRDDDEGCLDSEECREALRESMQMFRLVGVDWVKVDELLEHERMELLTIENYSLCAHCREEAQKVIIKHRKQFWNALPRLFNVDVDGWALIAAK